VNRYRSRFERNFAKDLSKLGVKFTYETDRIPYLKEATYTPDFKIGNMYIETKGRFISSDRTKHLRIKEQHPELDIRFIFINSKNKLYKGSKTNYGEWCDKHGFLWADKTIPKEWLTRKGKK
jgi:hypothetical protein